MKDLGEILTIIPAKGSSVRLKNKNTTLLAGKPLLAYTIEAAIESKVCGEIMVSTEDLQVSKLAKDLGAKVPFLRPSYLSQDPYEVEDVCLHVLKQYEEIGKHFDTLIILLATSPLRAVFDIQESLRIFREKNGRFLMSVSETDPHLFDALEFSKDGTELSLLFPEMSVKPIRERPRCLRCNGAVTIVDVASFKEVGTYYGQPLLGYKMPWERSVDIDTEKDFMLAQWLIEREFVKKVS